MKQYDSDYSMTELFTETPDSLTSYRFWCKRAIAAIEPLIETDTLGPCDPALHGIVAKVVRRAKHHAYKWGLFRLAARLPERESMTPIDACLCMQRCVRYRIGRRRRSRLTPPQVAKRYGVSPDTVRGWI